jgi:DNA-directed RNA polymerase subunit RPC12/RpoP
MTNSNCLEGIACPKCGNDSSFRIEARTLAEVTDDGAETFGDMEWDADSYAECPECGHHGTVGEFLLDTAKDNATTTTKE